MQIVEHDVAAVLVHRCDWQGGTILLCHNLGNEPARVSLRLPEETPGTRCADLFAPATVLTVGDGGALDLDVPPYGALWYRLLRDGSIGLV